MLLLDGRVAANAWIKSLQTRVAALPQPPHLAIVQVGELPASNRYVAAKLKRAAEIGVVGHHVRLPVDTTEATIIAAVRELSDVTGIIIQLPLPATIKTQRVLDAVPRHQDVDGLARGNTQFVPATPRGILALLDFYAISLANKVVAVVGQSRLVGKPTADLCAKRGAKVLRMNSKTGLAGVASADIVIVAVGKPNLIHREHLKKGVVVIDVGISEVVTPTGEKRIVGDVDRASVDAWPAAISPVPGGVGPMTVAALLANVVDIAEKLAL